VIITGGLVSRHPVVLQAWSAGEGGVAAPAASETQAELAYRQVKMAILEGGLPPGFQASEQQLALKLNMSRTPMHQAIVRLEAEEWLELSPRRGVLIASIDAAEMREVYETLMALEGAAVSKLAKRPIDASDPTEAALQASCRACVTALEAEDLRAWAEADHAFHTLLVDVSGNRRLARLARSVSEQAHRARLLTVRLRPSGDPRCHRQPRTERRSRRPGAASPARYRHTGSHPGGAGAAGLAPFGALTRVLRCGELTTRGILPCSLAYQNAQP
jgi:DNA-binding GntR family transcriptional regulator